MPADAFNPDEFAAFKAIGRAVPDDLDPEEFAQFKASRPAPTADPAPLALKVKSGEAASGGWLEAAVDAGKTIAPGLARGVTGLLGFPNVAIGAAETYLTGPAARATIRAFGGVPASDRGLDGRTHLEDRFVAPETMNNGINAGLRRFDLPEMYTPKTTPGEYANTVAEFLPNALTGFGSLAQRAAQVAVPAAVSETAGQVARRSSPEWEGAARLVGALGGGAGTAIAQAPRGGRATLREAIRDLPEGSLDDAAALGERSRGLPGGGLNLSIDELLNRVTSGQATRATQLARVVGNSGGEGQRLASEFYAARPGQVDATGRALFEALSPQLSDPSALGGALQRSARAGVAQTAEGQALQAARDAAGPRVTSEQAGMVMQPELARIYQGREGMRSAIAEQEYGAARQAPERIGVDRTIRVERPGEPIITRPEYGRPQFMDDAPRPLDPPPTAEAAGSAGPESLARFVARHGGLRLDGDVLATDLHRFNIPGVGNVAREGGKSLDNFWRERLIEAGYLKPDLDGGAARDITSELLRKLQNEQRGLPSYPIGAERQAAAARSAPGQVIDEYKGALSTAERRLDDDLAKVGVEPASLHPDVRSRTLGAVMRGEHVEPLDAYERVVAGMRENPPPYSRSTTVEEEISAPRFGQANPGDVVGHIDEALRAAKGPVALALQQARKTLFEQDSRTLDFSVAGLHGAREAIGDLIDKGAPQTQRALIAVRDRLDQALSSVPEYEHARSGFEAASRPLDPFDVAAPGRIVARDQASGRMTMPPERAPSAVDEGPSQARAFNQVATPAARQAYEGRLTTRILDAANDGQGTPSAERLRAIMRDEEDQLGQFPAVRERLQNVALAREGMAAVERSPLGQIADKPDVRRAIDALFPMKPLAGSEREVGAAMYALRRNDPNAAEQLARVHLETVFDDAVKDRRGLPAQFGGAGFASAVRGNPQQRKNLEAALRVLPDGNTRLKAFDHLMEAFEATGYRPQKGSDTAFNLRIQDELGGGRSVGGAIASAATHGAAGGGVGGLAGATSGAVLGIKKSASDAWLRFQIGRNGGEIARLLFDPRALPELRALAQSKPGTKTSDAFLARLATLASAGATSGDAAAGRVPAAR